MKHKIPDEIEIFLLLRFQTEQQKITIASIYALKDNYRE